jgi:hypothetical protein
MNANAITDSGNISFNAVTNTVGGIQNQNLVDKTAVEVISGAWTFSDDITIADGQWIGLGSGANDANILFTDAGGVLVDTITMNNANVIIETGNWIGIGPLNARVSFQSGPDSITVSDQLNIGDNITFQTDNFIGLGGAGFGRIGFENLATDRITVSEADFVVAGNNNYYVCTAANCTETPTAATGRTITVRNNGVLAGVSQFNGVALIEGSSGAGGASIANGETVYVVYDGANWVLIGEGH